MHIMTGDTRKIELVELIAEQGWGRMWAAQNPTPTSIIDCWSCQNTHFHRGADTMTRLTRALEAVRHNLAQHDGCKVCGGDGWLPGCQYDEILSQYGELVSCASCNSNPPHIDPPLGYQVCCTHAHVTRAVYDYHADDLGFDTMRTKR
jgi:hypothetical protein